ncbi:hypothetical protein D4Z76_09390 [Campylobacter coli]|nr:hypothetical protein D4Z76_09390 [Campylobacter coli]
MGDRTDVKFEGELEGSMKHTARAVGEALWAHKAGDDWGHPECSPTAVNHRLLCESQGPRGLESGRTLSDSGCHKLMNTKSMLSTFLFADSDFLC